MYKILERITTNLLWEFSITGTLCIFLNLPQCANFLISILKFLINV